MRFVSFCRHLLWLNLAITSYAFAGQTPIQRYTMPTFNNIDIGGPANVHIDNKNKQPAVEVFGDQDNLANVTLDVRGNTLHIGMQPDFQTRPNSYLSVYVHAPRINKIYYHGTGQVTGTGLQGPLYVTSTGSGNMDLSGKYLDLCYLDASGSGNITVRGVKSSLFNLQGNGSGNITLQGDAVVQSLNYNGTGALSLLWVNSSNVMINSNGGQLALAGNAGTLSITLGGNASLNAKELRAQRVFVNTSGNSRADVWAKQSLSAMATENSSIYYYNDAGYVGSYTTPPAVILRMTGIREHEKVYTLRHPVRKVYGCAGGNCG